MKFRKIIINLSLIVIPLFIIEIVSSILILKKEDKVGFLFSPFSNKKSNQINYEINWDKKTKKIIPGKYKVKLNDGSTNEYTINSKGFRNKEFNKNKVTDYRIISFGGSSTMGIESPDDYTYPAQLEKKFIKNNIDTEVLNFGFSSKSLNFIRELFFNEAINYNPDFITIYSARNSIMYDSIGTKMNVKKINFFNLYKMNTYLVNNIMTFRIMYKIYNKILSASIDSKKIISPYDQKIEHNIYYFKNQYFDTLNQIIELAKKSGIKVVLIKQAIYIEPEAQKIVEKKSLDDLVKSLENIRQNNKQYFNYSDNFWILTVNILNKQIDKFKTFNNVVVIDPVKNLLKDKNNFVDYLHLTQKGNKVLADEIFKELKKHL
mgnify:CR=1 FL=1